MMHAIAYWGCVNTIRVNSGRKFMPLLQWGIKPASVQRLVFGPMLYQLSYPAPSCWCRNVAWSSSKECSGKMKFSSKWICSPTPHGKFCLWLASCTMQNEVLHSEPTHHWMLEFGGRLKLKMFCNKPTLLMLAVLKKNHHHCRLRKIMMITNVFIKHKILSRETMLSAYIHHTHWHTQVYNTDYMKQFKLHLHTTWTCTGNKDGGR